MPHTRRDTVKKTGGKVPLVCGPKEERPKETRMGILQWKSNCQEGATKKKWEKKKGH